MHNSYKYANKRINPITDTVGSHRPLAEPMGIVTVFLPNYRSILTAHDG